MQRVTTSAENAVALQRVFGEINVTDLLGKVTTPTLVGHCTRDAVVPFDPAARWRRGSRARVHRDRAPTICCWRTDPGWPKYARIVEGFWKAERSGREE